MKIMETGKNGTLSQESQLFQHFFCLHHISKQKEYKYLPKASLYIRMIKQQNQKFQKKQQIFKMTVMLKKLADKIKERIKMRIKVKLQIMIYKQTLQIIYDNNLSVFKQFIQKNLKQNIIFIQNMTQTGQSYFSIRDTNIILENTNSQHIQKGKRGSSKVQYSYNLVEQKQRDRHSKTEKLCQLNNTFENTNIYQTNKMKHQVKAEDKLLIANKQNRKSQKNNFHETNVRLNLDLSESNEKQDRKKNQEKGEKQYQQKSQAIKHNKKNIVKMRGDDIRIFQNNQKQTVIYKKKESKILQSQSLERSKGQQKEQFIIGMAQLKQSFFGSLKQLSTTINGQNLFLVRKSCTLIQSPNFYLYRSVIQGDKQIGYLQGNQSGTIYNFYYSNENNSQSNCLLMMTVYFPVQSIFGLQKPKSFEVFIREQESQIPNENYRNLKQLYEQDPENISRITKLKTKKPVWVSSKGYYAMNFKGLCSETSVENFILLQERSKKEVMIFCKNNDFYSYRISENLQDSMVAALIAATLDFKWFTE